LPYSLVTWKEWRTKYPWTLVLSRDAGFNRDYGTDPYSGYESSCSLMFPIKNNSERYHPKEKVLVIISGDVAKAYPFSELDKAPTPLEDKVGDREVVINYKNGNFIEANGLKVGISYPSP